MIKKNINPFQRFPDHVLIFIILHYSRCGICLNTDTINSTLVLRDSDTIVSAGNQFTLGFFTPNGTTTNTTKRYMGIWYSVSQASPAWVANRDNPLNDSLGTIAIHSNGNIVLMNGNRDIVWSTNATLSNNSTIMNSTAQLLDTGNLVLTDTSTGSTIWESHEHPVDSYLATMRFSHNPRTGARTDLNSWRTFRDPGRGNFTAGIYAVGVPQYFIWENGVPRWRSGPWNGRVFTGVSGMNSVYDNGYSISTEADGTYYFTRNFRQGYLSRHYLNADGFLVKGVWDERRSNWNETWVVPENDCNLYNKCGQNAVCDSEASPICSCLRGYEPRDRREWDRGTWSGGCARQTLLQCERANNATDRNREDGFLRLTLIKVPDFMQRSSSAEAECASMCLTNCSCLAYAHDSGIGCMFWYENLIDVQKFPAIIGSYFYVRVAYSEIDKGKSNKTVVTVTVITSLVAALICLFLVWWTYKRKGTIWTFKGAKGQSDLSKNMLQSDKDKVNIELPLYSFKTLESATCNFALVNKLGAGGFGPVYKGKLENEREVAVKRLSTTSGQGSEEFMNEVAVISKLQHRNLVRLLGCCVEKEEKMLIYEYLSNKSLDVYLFDTKKNVLDWKKRLNIMEGIGRGLQYLHRDSRLRIIHRDLKPSNILLDENWTPKISDFGMARIFGGNQDQANTGKVVGTYGYMAPEYALGGRFSEKSDVFSFGVLVLEIISGIRNTSFYNEEFSLGLLGYTWKLWKEDNAGHMVDKWISNNISFQTEIMRCIHIGLLCVQEFPANRPSISNVLMMLCSEIVDLPAPEHPGFTDRWNRTNVGSTPSTRTCSVNTISNTVLEGR